MQLMPNSYSCLTNQPPATRLVDFVITRMTLALIALLFVLLPLLIINSMIHGIITMGQREKMRPLSVRSLHGYIINIPLSSTTDPHRVQC